MFPRLRRAGGVQNLFRACGAQGGPTSFLRACGAHDTAQYDTTRRDALRYDTLRYDTARRAIRYDTTRYDAIRYDTVSSTRPRGAMRSCACVVARAPVCVLAITRALARTGILHACAIACVRVFARTRPRARAFLRERKIFQVNKTGARLNFFSEDRKMYDFSVVPRCLFCIRAKFLPG